MLKVRFRALENSNGDKYFGSNDSSDLLPEESNHTAASVSLAVCVYVYVYVSVCSRYVGAVQVDEVYRYICLCVRKKVDISVYQYISISV